MNKVFLYAGQGSQVAGMGKDFYEQYEEYREVADLVKLDFDALKLMHDGDEKVLSQTEFTQPCMAIFAAGVTKLLAKKGIVPDAVCGLSLGEYGALYGAGVIDEKDYIETTAFRGKVMTKAALGCTTAMSAILGVESSVVEEECNNYKGNYYVTVANYNCPGQYVICGDEEAVSTVEESLKARGAKRCVRLNVSGPFHTKYMKAAGDDLRTHFENVEFNEPKIPIALNVTGDFYKSDEDIKEILIRQVQSSVRFENQLRKMIEAGARDFIEIGPGNVLSGFLKKTAKAMDVAINVDSVSTVEDFKRVVGE